MDEIQQAILDFVRKEYLDEDDELELALGTPLISSGIVDSFSMVSLKTFLERRYQIQIPDGRATPDDFDSVERIASLVRELTGKKTG